MAPAVSAHVLVEVQFAPRPQDAVQVGERRRLVGDRTEYERRDRHVERGVLKWELVSYGVDNTYRRDCAGRRRGRAGADTARLDSDDPAHALRVVGGSWRLRRHRSQ